MTRPQKPPEQRGLGWEHRRQVASLKAAHVDGSPCYWCGNPMFLDKEQNWDRESLAGDHTVPRLGGKRVGTKADRLLHGLCNKSRGDGSRDHLRPAVTGGEMPQTAGADRLGRRLMPWPI